MSTVRDDHDKAMELSQLAYVARIRGDLDRSKELAAEALVSERLAAEKVPMTDRAEPTRSILFRSAASLALQSDQYAESRRLVGEGLRGNPPEMVAKELEDVLSAIRSAQYLSSRSLTVSAQSLLLRLAGNAVLDGSVALDQFVDRTNAIKSMVRRVVELKEMIPFTSQGAPRKLARNLTPVLAGLEQGSFVARFDFMISDSQASLFFTADDIVADLIKGVDLVQSGDIQQLLAFTRSDEELAKNLVSSVRALAPDGTDISEVDLVGRASTARITRPRDEFIPQIALAESTQEAGTEIGLTIDGYIDAAFKGANSIKIVPLGEVEGSRPLTLHVSEGLTEMVERFWREPSLRVVYDVIEGRQQLVVMDPIATA